MAEILHLVRWAEPQVDPGLPPYLSTVVRTAYDCTGKKERYLASTSYAGNLGNERADRLANRGIDELPRSA